MVHFILDNKMFHQNFIKEAPDMPPKKIWSLYLWFHSLLTVNLGTFLNLSDSQFIREQN